MNEKNGKILNPKTDFAEQINKGNEEFLPSVDSSVPLIHHYQSDLGLICLVRNATSVFWI